MAKTSTGLAVTTLAIILLAGFAAKLSFAVPLSPNWLKQATFAGREESVQEYKKVTSRLEKRDTSEHVNPDYSEVIFSQRKIWKSKNCTGEFNCAPINPLQCRYSQEYYTTERYSEDARGCAVDFSIAIDAGSVAEGAELALFKKKEQPAGGVPLYYYVFILYKRQNETMYSKILTDRIVNSSCNSWQVFTLSDINSSLPANQVHNITLLVAVFDLNKLNPTPLSCGEIRNLFIIDTNVSVENFINGDEQQEAVTEPINPDEQAVQKDAHTANVTEEVDGKKNTDDLQSLGEIVKPKDEMGSGDAEVPVDEKIGTTEPVPTITPEKYLPTIGVFVSGSSIINPTINQTKNKRSVGEQLTSDNKNFTEDKSTEEGDNDAGVECRRHENKILTKDLDRSYVAPDFIDLGRCSNSTNEGVECVPEQIRHPQVIMIVTDDKGHIHSQIITLTNVTVILTCTSRNTTISSTTTSSLNTTTSSSTTTSSLNVTTSSLNTTPPTA